MEVMIDEGAQENESHQDTTAGQQHSAIVAQNLAQPFQGPGAQAMHDSRKDTDLIEL